MVQWLRRLLNICASLMEKFQKTGKSLAWSLIAKGKMIEVSAQVVEILFCLAFRRNGMVELSQTKQWPTVEVSLDLEKAYDRVDRCDMWRVLQLYGVQEQLVFIKTFMRTPRAT